MSDSIDPTHYGTEAKVPDINTYKKQQLQKRADIHQIITGDERLVKLRKFNEKRYADTMDAILSADTPPEDIPVIRARAQVYKEYKSIFDKMVTEGLKAIEELKNL